MLEESDSPGFMPKQWDAVISHASEDKDDFVRPLAQALNQLGVRIWYDEFARNIGDSLSRAVDKGLAESSYGIAIISPSFIEKANNRYYWQIVVKAKSRSELVKVIQLLPANWNYDLDPTNLL